MNKPHPKKTVFQGIQEGLELFLAKVRVYIKTLSLIKGNCTIDQMQNCPYIALLQFLFRIHVSNVNVCKLLTNSVVAPINMRQTASWRLALVREVNVIFCIGFLYFQPEQSSE